MPRPRSRPRRAAGPPPGRSDDEKSQAPEQAAGQEHPTTTPDSGARALRPVATLGSTRSRAGLLQVIGLTAACIAPSGPESGDDEPEEENEALSQREATPIDEPSDTESVHVNACLIQEEEPPVATVRWLGAPSGGVIIDPIPMLSIEGELATSSAIEVRVVATVDGVRTEHLAYVGVLDPQGEVQAAVDLALYVPKIGQRYSGEIRAFLMIQTEADHWEAHSDPLFFHASADQIFIYDEVSLKEEFNHGDFNGLGNPDEVTVTADDEVVELVDTAIGHALNANTSQAAQWGQEN